MFSKLLYAIVKIYFENVPPRNEQLMLFFKIIKILGFSIFIFILPLLVNYVMQVKLNRPKKIFFSVISLSVLSLYFLKSLFKFSFMYDSIIFDAFFMLITIYCIVVVIFNLKHITDKRLIIIIITFLVLSIIYLPLGMFDIVNGESGILLPVYLFIINTLSVVFCFFYLDPPAAAKKVLLTGQLAEKYNITRREEEIIALIQMGYSNIEISEEMSISVSTVEKHIYNIYQKLNINKRIQLINLINAGE